MKIMRLKKDGCNYFVVKRGNEVRKLSLEKVFKLVCAPHAFPHKYCEIEYKALRKWCDLNWDWQTYHVETAFNALVAAGNWDSVEDLPAAFEDVWEWQHKGHLQ